MGRALWGVLLAGVVTVLGVPAAAEAKKTTWVATISGKYTFSAEATYTGDETIGCTITDRQELEYEGVFESRLPVAITVTDQDPPIEGGISIGPAKLPVRVAQNRRSQFTYIHQGEDCSGTYPQDPDKCAKQGRGAMYLHPDTYLVFESGQYEELIGDSSTDTLTVDGILKGDTDCWYPLLFADDYVNRFFAPAASGDQQSKLLLDPNRDARRNGITLKGSQGLLESGVAGPDDDGLWNSGWSSRWKMKLTLAD